MLQFKVLIFLFVAIITLCSCGNTGPEPIAVNKDQCSECKMTIADQRHSAEWITPKGRVYKFDDLHCLLAYYHKNETLGEGRFYLSNYQEPHNLIIAQNAVIVNSNEIRAPMGGSFAVFENGNKASEFIGEKTGSLISWVELLKKQP